MHRRAHGADTRLVLRLDAHVICRLTLERRQREVGKRVAETALHLLAHPFRPAVVDHELQPRLDA